MHDPLSNYVDEATRSVFKEGVSSWRALKRRDDWNHWLKVGHAIATAQDIAATYANGQPSGRRFNEFMARCYASPTYLGEFAEIDKSARSYAVKCWRHRDEVEKRRQIIGEAAAMKLNHPQAVWRDFENSRRPPIDRATPIASPFEKTKQALATALEEVHQKDKVIERLKKEQDNEVAFSLKDTNKNIGLLLASALGDRWPGVQTETTKEYDRRRNAKKAKPT